LRVIYEDPQIRGSPSPGVPRSDGGACFHRTLPGAGIQPEALALDAGLPATGRIRTAVAHASTIGASMRHSMRFFRHDGIYRSDVGNQPLKPGEGYRLPLVGPEPQSKDETGGTTAPCSSSEMSSGRLFLDRVARQHCPSPLHRHGQTNTHPRPASSKQDISTWQRIGHFYFALTD